MCSVPAAQGPMRSTEAVFKLHQGTCGVCPKCSNPTTPAEKETDRDGSGGKTEKI